MKKVFGLIMKEHIQYKKTIGVLLLSTIFMIGVLPYAIHYYRDVIPLSSIRTPLLFLGISLIVLNAISSFFMSLNRAIKMKMLWLHHPNSIVLLVFAKFIYQLVAMHLLLAVALFGLYFLPEVINGTAGQIFMLSLYVQLICNVIYILFTVLLLVLLAITLQLKPYIGKFSYVVSTLLFVGFFLSADPFTFQFLEIGRIPTEKISTYLPTFTNGLTITAMDVYVVYELMSFIFYAALFIVACKWIERVITR